MGRTFRILTEEQEAAIKEAVELHVYDSPWQKAVYQWHKKTTSLREFRIAVALIWFLDAILYLSGVYGGWVTILSGVYLVGFGAVLIASHILQSIRWRLAYQEFKRDTGIFDMHLIDFRLRGKKYVK